MGALDRWLSEDEVRRLTGYARHKAQCRELAKLGVPFTVSAQGAPLVDAARYFAESKAGRPREPNWDAQRGPKAA